MDRQATITLALGGTQFHLERFEAVERLSEPFAILVEGFSPDEVDFLPHLGKPVSLDAAELGEHVRYFHGRLTEAALIKADVNGSHYRLMLRPWFYLLDQNRNYRIFQEKSVVDIAREVLRDAGMNDVDFDKLTGSYKARTYCVQYKESDFNFLSRLFESEGISYYFRHEQSAHKLVLCDSKSAHKAAPGYDKISQIPVEGQATGFPKTLWGWSERVSTVAQAHVTFRAYDFTKPQSPVEAKSQTAGQHPGDALEIYDYPDTFTDASAGQAGGALRLAAARSQRRIFEGEGDALGLACGGLFTLEKSTVGRFNREYLITGIRHTIEDNAYRSTGQSGRPRHVLIDAIPSDTPFRPLPVTPKPVAAGVETATVTGPAGEIIYVDEYGRVKVRFHWDRSPDDPGKTSCWMRVSHHAAGEGFGNVDLPRVGQEVIVDFVNGDPDRPIITGRVYNAQRKHTYDLPEHKTRSLWRTQTVGDSGDYSGAEPPSPSGKGFNEVRLEDKGGEEEIYIHAQRKMLTEVLLDDELKIKRDRKTRVGRDRVTEIKNDETKTVEEGDDKTTIKAGDYSIKVDKGAVTIEAAVSITLKVGQTSIVLDTSSITLKAQTITSEATTVNKVKGGMVDIEGDTLAKMKAVMITIN